MDLTNKMGGRGNERPEFAGLETSMFNVVSQARVKVLTRRLGREHDSRVVSFQATHSRNRTGHFGLKPASLRPGMPVGLPQTAKRQGQKNKDSSGGNAH
jgi:hypothetical protein